MSMFVRMTVYNIMDYMKIITDGCKLTGTDPWSDSMMISCYRELKRCKRHLDSAMKAYAETPGCIEYERRMTKCPL